VLNCVLKVFFELTHVKLQEWLLEVVIPDVTWVVYFKGCNHQMICGNTRNHINLPGQYTENFTQKHSNILERNIVENTLDCIQQVASY
jgi:hypothetical protein